MSTITAMHKGRNYELEPRYRPFSAGNVYPNWAPKALTITLWTWQGTEAASVPDVPQTFIPTGVTPEVRARYECELWDNGGGDRAVLFLDFYLVDGRTLRMRVGGDWGINGELPDAARYNFNGQWTSFSSFILASTTPPELFLAPTRLVWEFEPYP